jgi:hypothetical protein
MRPSKRPGIVVAGLQVLIIIVLVAVHYVWRDPHFLVRYYEPARNLVLKENFPLVVLLAPVAYALQLCGGLPSPVRGICLAIGTTFLGIALLPSVGFFWYFVATETGMRMRGQSRLRFHNAIAESAVLLVLFLMGAGAILYVLSNKASWLSGNNQIAVLVGNACLLVWGAVLLAVAIADFRWLLKSRSSFAAKLRV